MVFVSNLYNANAYRSYGIFSTDVQKHESAGDIQLQMTL